MTNRSAPPPHLATPERRLWQRLVSDYSIDDSGGQAVLQVACEAAERVRGAREAITRDGLLIDGKPHPLLLVERDSRKLFLQAIRQLDLDTEDAGDVGRPAQLDGWGKPPLKRVR